MSDPKEPPVKRNVFTSFMEVDMTPKKSDVPQSDLEKKIAAEVGNMQAMDRLHACARTLICELKPC
jgi:hypothetical protein